MKKILIIEDNDSNRYMISYLLNKQGFETIEAVNGVSGYNVAIREKVDLILIDIQLPDINGLDVTKKIRAEIGVDVVPIVALTSYAMAGDREKAMKAGCTGYIEKPIEPEKFVSQIRAYFFK